MKLVIDNDTFVSNNFEKLVRRFPHQRVVICNGEIFTGPDAAKNARKKYRKLTPLLLPVPGPEEFAHIL